MRLKTKLLIVVAGLAISAVAGLRLYSTVKGYKTSPENDHVKLFKEAVSIVKTRYVDEVDNKKLIQGAIDGMLAKLDPHSAFMTPEPYKEMRVNMAGSFGGLGIEINIKDGKLTVISPIEDTPAWRAGIKSNDHIWKIDDKLTKGLSITQSVGLMRGEKGTKVTLHIIREGEKKPLSFPLIRDIIKTKSLRSRTILPGFGLIRVIQFQERTGEDFGNALQNLHAENPEGLKGLIIDLRNNPGGLVDTAVQVADRFVGEGREDGTIVAMKGRIPSAKMTYYAKVGEKEPRYPIVVLINGGSASASEILAGALQDQGRAIVMGTQSYGKGSVQSVLSLREGYGLKITTARYYTPKGRSIQVKGITPDIIVTQVNLNKPAAKTAGQAEGGDPDFREKDLQNHFKGPEEKPAAQPPAPMPGHPAGKSAPAKPQPPAKDPQPAGTLQTDAELASDYQLARAVEMLKGLDVFQAINQNKQTAAPPPSATGQTVK